MRAALLFAPKFKDKTQVRRILELRGWSIVGSRPDIVIVVGGDGSILYAEHEFPGKPILSFNCGELGFLAGDEVEDIEKALKQLESGKYGVDERNKLEFTVGNKRGTALNEVLVASSVVGKALRMNIAVDDEALGFFVCDGVLVATPTGSTGYNSSCGGPVIEPGTPAFALTLINPHLSKLKSMVVRGDRKITISFTRQNPGIKVVADGLGAIRASHNATITVKKSRKKTKLVTGPNEYYKKLRAAFT